jgi:hypothetical protein
VRARPSGLTQAAAVRDAPFAAVTVMLPRNRMT